MHFEEVSLGKVKEQIARGEISMMPPTDDAPGKEWWVRLCELAVIEQDPDKLMTLVNEINRLLGDKEEPCNQNEIGELKDNMLDQNQHKRTVISVGSIPELISLREQILKSKGYEVFSTTIPPTADLLIGLHRYDILLICYSLPDDWRKRLIENFRANCPQGRVVVVTNYPVVQTSKEADALVYGVEGPEALMDAVEGKAA